MGNDNKVKNIILTVLVIGLVSMTIAYAALTQTLYIRDNQVTITTDWNVHFAHTHGATDAVASSTGATSTATINQQPTLTDTVISGLRATFRKPGDKVTFQFDIVNEGGIDAKLSTATYATPTCTSTDQNVSSSDLATFCSNHINYSIVYTGTNTAPAQNDDLLVYDEDDSSTNANIRHCTLTVELDPNTEITDIPNGDITVSNIEATFIYVQK
ncbi:MAG: hypothetical protein IKF36_00340 [Bacilli bacterium]|nr:hypothetical protein [Bacilli bacterium]